MVTDNTFKLASVSVEETRAEHQDTNYVALALSQNGNVISEFGKKVGGMNNVNRPNETYNYDDLIVNMADEYNDADEFVFSYLVTNHGGGKTEEIIAACKAALSNFTWNKFSAYDAEPIQVQGSDFQLPRCMASGGGGANMANRWNEMQTAFNNVPSDKCDGPVAIDALSFTGQMLTQIQEQRNLQDPFAFLYRGIHSPVGCGKNSNYTIGWYSYVREVPGPFKGPQR